MRLATIPNFYIYRPYLSLASDDLCRKKKWDVRRTQIQAFSPGAGGCQDVSKELALINCFKAPGSRDTLDARD